MNSMLTMAETLFMTLVALVVYMILRADAWARKRTQERAEDRLDAATRERGK